MYVYIYIYIYIYIYMIYIYIYDNILYIYDIYNQIMHRNPCFNLFTLHNSFDNQGSKINKTIVFFTF